MKGIFFFFLLLLGAASCTKAQQINEALKPEAVNYSGACAQMAVIKEPFQYESNIIEGPRTFLARFEDHEIIRGKDWDSLFIYENDALLYQGDATDYWLNGATKVIEGGGYTISIDVCAGTGTIEYPNGAIITLNTPTYNGHAAGNLRQ